MALKITSGIDNFNPWSGAVYAWNTIQDEGKIEDLDFLLEELYPEGIDEGKLNDLLWFEYEWLFESLGISDDEDDEEDNDEQD